jgi:ATP-dependent Clp protease ATP-binding subunit ClpC
MREELHKHVIGQNAAIDAITRAIQRSRAGLKSNKRPVGLFLLLGPTGVGKTLVAKSLASFLFGSEDALITIDMSEYMEKFAVSRLAGAPPGYVGYNEGGQLTEQVRRRPYSVVLFDEIEKAHPDVFNTLLQILEEGQMTDSTGRRVDFRNTVIVMTSNVGARRITKNVSLGFQKASSDDQYQSMRDRVVDEAKKVFNPEFLNRVDEIIVFHRLTGDELREIVELNLTDVMGRLKEKGIDLVLTDEAKDYIVKKGTDEEYGARPLRRAVQQYVEDPLSEQLLMGAFEPGSRIVVQVSDISGDLMFNTELPVAESVSH